MPRILSLSCRISLPICVPFFQRPLSSCAEPSIPFLCQAAPILQLLYTTLKLHGHFLCFLGLLPTRYRVASPSRSCNLTAKVLPCFMMGSVCPVHALYGPAPAEFDPFVKLHQPCTAAISVFGSLPMICTRYIPGISDRARFPPCPSRLLLSVRVLILKGYENLHFHFEDCVGRRVTNA